ncbi:hypothetical protein AcV7_002390 [Taiwanofungus camphoratus]|nr:hypothetical protein AcV7_002390 [Antrodia cinnamomea]
MMGLRCFREIEIAERREDPERVDVVKRIYFYLAGFQRVVQMCDNQKDTMCFASVRFGPSLLPTFLWLAPPSEPRTDIYTEQLSVATTVAMRCSLLCFVLVLVASAAGAPTKLIVRGDGTDSPISDVLTSGVQEAPDSQDATVGARQALSPLISGYVHQELSSPLLSGHVHQEVSSSGHVHQGLSVHQELSPLISGHVHQELSPLISGHVHQELSPLISGHVHQELSPLISGHVHQEASSGQDLSGPLLSGHVHQEVSDDYVREDFGSGA